MDPLSITASVLAIIEVADKIISVCKSYISTVRDAPIDLRTILIEVGGVKCVLEALEVLLHAEDRDMNSTILQKLGDDGSALEGCNQALKALETLFPAQVEQSTQGKRRKMTASLQNLAWPFKEGKARKLLEDIQRHKTTISLMLTTETV
jgi:hypothetical protein